MTAVCASCFSHIFVPLNTSLISSSVQKTPHLSPGWIWSAYKTVACAFHCRSEPKLCMCVISRDSWTAPRKARLTPAVFAHFRVWRLQTHSNSNGSPRFNWFFHTSLTNYGQNSDVRKIVGASRTRGVPENKVWQVWTGSTEPLSPPCKRLWSHYSHWLLPLQQVSQEQRVVSNWIQADCWTHTH